MLSTTSSQFLKVKKISHAGSLTQSLQFVQARLFNFYLLIIGCVSVYDTWLVYAYRNVIHDLERNEICLTLIKMEPRFASYFVVAKLSGTVFVLSALVTIWKFNTRVAFASATAVTTFQVSLFCYLTLADFDVCRLY